MTAKVVHANREGHSLLIGTFKDWRGRPQTFAVDYHRFGKKILAGDPGRVLVRVLGRGDYWASVSLPIPIVPTPGCAPCHVVPRHTLDGEEKYFPTKTQQAAPPCEKCRTIRTKGRPQKAPPPEFWEFIRDNPKVSLRAAGEQFGVDHKTIGRWIKEKQG